MAEVIEITPDLKESLDALENARNITKTGVLFENATDCDFIESESIGTACYHIFWTEAPRLIHLSNNAEVYGYIAAELIQSHSMQDKGTEEDGEDIQSD